MPEFGRFQRDSIRAGREIVQFDVQIASTLIWRHVAVRSAARLRLAPTRMRNALGRCSQSSDCIGALIYVRVSTKERTENLSLPTQLKACERQGFQVLSRFREEGESAKSANRTELQKLLQFCRKNKGTVQFVVVFNLTRFAREKYDHFALRALRI